MHGIYIGTPCNIGKAMPERLLLLSAAQQTKGGVNLFTDLLPADAIHFLKQTPSSLFDQGCLQPTHCPLKSNSLLDSNESDLSITGLSDAQTSNGKMQDTLAD